MPLECLTVQSWGSIISTDDRFMRVQRYYSMMQGLSENCFFLPIFNFSIYVLLFLLQQCSINHPQNGPLPPDAPSWCQAPFDPEGLLSSVMAIVTCLIGLQFGHIIIHFEKHKGRIINWLIPSFSMLALAFSMDFIGIRMNKPLYTISYALATSGAAGLLFAGIYTLVSPLN
jgi:hypothetical protein